MHARWSDPPCIRCRSKECLLLNTTLVLRSLIPDFGDIRRWQLGQFPLFCLSFGCDEEEGRLGSDDVCWGTPVSLGGTMVMWQRSRLSGGRGGSRDSSPPRKGGDSPQMPENWWGRD